MSAPYPRRVAAWAVDALVALTPLWMISPVVAVMALSGSADQELAALHAVSAAWVVALVLYPLIVAVQGYRGAQTPGQRLAGLRRELPEEGAGRSTAIRAAVPLAVATGCLLSGLVPLLALLPLSALISPSGRGLSDVLAGQRLVLAGADA